MDRQVLKSKQLVELKEIAAALQLTGYKSLKKADLIDLIAGGSGDDTEPAGNGKAAEATASTTSDGSEASDGDSTDGGSSSDESSSDESSSDEGASAADRVRARRRQRGDVREEPRAPRDRDDRSDRDDRDRDDRDDRDDRGRDQDDDGRDDDDQDNDGELGEDGQPQVQRRSRNRNRNRNKGRGKGGQGGDGYVDYDDLESREGVLDLLPEGYGFLRTTGYLAGDRDVYVSQSFVRRFGLRRGDVLGGPIRFNKGNDKFPALVRVDTIEGERLGEDGQRPAKRVDFKDLTPLFPDEQLVLETDADSPIAMRIVDMLAPIGKGQRGLIVSPPKAGKTTILKQLAKAIETNDPDVHLMVLLVDERPEEVTDFARSTNGEVISSTFDRPAEDHTQVAELCLERAKRLVERGRDVVILLDSVTRLGRAYNLAAPASGRVLSGGIDSAALYPPKRFFGAARNIEGGGSLTILATALIETGSKMDEVIFEEFKGTGNMELRLDRRMEQKRVFPAVDVATSGTRREDLLIDEDRLETIWKLRRVLSQMEGGAGLELLIDKLKATKTNTQFLAMIAKSTL